jgi:hypothetical protein
MTPFMNGFTDELVKISAARNSDPVLREARLHTKVQGDADDIIRQVGGTKSKKRDYLRSAITGAAVYPLAMLGGRALQRITANLMKAKGAKSLKLLSKKKPLATGGEAVDAAGRGAIMGSAYQALLDSAKRKSEKQR